jgi:erythromycin esterase-like protein
VGFAFGQGGLNAVESIAGFLGSLKAFNTPGPAADSYEATLRHADPANYYIDLRQATDQARKWLDGPRPLRSIGTSYFPTDQGLNYSLAALTFQFDVLIFIETTTPSTLLPFQY